MDAKAFLAVSSAGLEEFCTRCLRPPVTSTECLLFVRAWTHPATTGTGPCENCFVLWAVLMVYSWEGLRLTFLPIYPRLQYQDFHALDASLGYLLSAYRVPGSVPGAGRTVGHGEEDN